MDDEIKKLLYFASNDSSNDKAPPVVSPLGTAALRNNWILFRLLYDMYEVLQGDRWSREQVNINVSCTFMENLDSYRGSE